MIGFGRKKLYCDAAATTPLDRGVARAMKKAEKIFANPSSIYMRGAEAKKRIAEERARVGRILSVRAEEIVFTSGGTESNNLAIQGTIARQIGEGRAPDRLHIVTSAIEHSSVLKACEALEEIGIRVSYIPPQENGIVRAADIRKAISEDTVLVSVMYVNNETGAIQPIHDIAKGVKEEIKKREASGNVLPVYLHTDASQALLSLHSLPHSLGADLMTIDAHKMYGPKGVGILYVKSGTGISPMMHGGGQERGLRSTTESLPLIAGCAEALARAAKDRDGFSKRMEAARSAFVSELKRLLPEAEVNGTGKDRVPHIANVFVPGIDAEFAALKLDRRGVECATKSSCMRDEGESYVLRAMFKDGARARGSLRFSFLRDMKEKDARYAARMLAEVARPEKAR